VLLISWQQIKGKAPAGFLPVLVSPTLAHKYAPPPPTAGGGGGVRRRRKTISSTDRSNRSDGKMRLHF